jgi:hypothetical protein
MTVFLSDSPASKCVQHICALDDFPIDDVPLPPEENAPLTLSEQLLASAITDARTRLLPPRVVVGEWEVHIPVHQWHKVCNGLNLAFASVHGLQNRTGIKRRHRELVAAIAANAPVISDSPESAEAGREHLKDLAHALQVYVRQFAACSGVVDLEPFETGIEEHFYDELLPKFSVLADARWDDEDERATQREMRADLAGE